jgi:hypothetical protein
MATFNEIGAGGGSLGGCAIITYIKIYHTMFAAGDIVFNIDKAKKGVLEKVVIKRQRVINSVYTGGQFEVMYVDTLNALWNEWDLISHSEAVDWAQAHYERMLAEAAALRRC